MPLNLRNTRSYSGYMADPGHKPGVLTPKLTNCTTTPAWISQQDQKLASLSQMVPSGPHPEWLSICGSQPTWLSSLGMDVCLSYVYFRAVIIKTWVSGKDVCKGLISPYPKSLYFWPDCHPRFWGWSPLAVHPDWAPCCWLSWPRCPLLCSWVQPTRSAYFKGPLTWRVYLCLQWKVKMMSSLDRNTEAMTLRWNTI